MSGSFFDIFWFKIIHLIVHPFRSGIPLSIKWFLLLNLSFYSIFFYVFVYDLRCHITVNLFVGFHMGDSDDGAVSIK